MRVQFARDSQFTADLCVVRPALESSRRRDGGISPDGRDFAPLWLPPSLLTGTNRIGHSIEAVELDSWEKYLFLTLTLVLILN